MENSREVLPFMPQKKKFRIPQLGNTENYRHLWLLCIWIAYFIVFYFLQTRDLEGYWISYLPLDDHIPFLEGFVIPYVTWYPMLFLTTIYLAFWDVENFKKFMAYIGVGFFSICLIYLFFPNGQNLRPAVMPRENFCTWLLGLLQKADPPVNVCPSLHVVGCMGICAAVWHAPSLKKLRWPTLLLSVVVCASTVFVKQHSILDLFVSLPYGLAVYFIVYKRHKK